MHRERFCRATRGAFATQLLRVEGQCFVSVRLAALLIYPELMPQIEAAEIRGVPPH